MPSLHRTLALNPLPFARDVGKQLLGERVLNLQQREIKRDAQPLQAEYIAIGGEGRTDAAEKEAIALDGLAQLGRAGLGQRQFQEDRLGVRFLGELTPRLADVRRGVGSHAQPTNRRCLLLRHGIDHYLSQPLRRTRLLQLHGHLELIVDARPHGPMMIREVNHNLGGHPQVFKAYQQTHALWQRFSHVVKGTWQLPQAKSARPQTKTIVNPLREYMIGYGLAKEADQSQPVSLLSQQPAH